MSEQSSLTIESTAMSSTPTAYTTGGPVQPVPRINQINSAVTRIEQKAHVIIEKILKKPDHTVHAPLLNELQFCMKTVVAAHVRYLKLIVLPSFQMSPERAAVEEAFLKLLKFAEEHFVKVERQLNVIAAGSEEAWRQIERMCERIWELEREWEVDH